MVEVLARSNAHLRVRGVPDADAGEAVTAVVRARELLGLGDGDVGSRVRGGVSAGKGEKELRALAVGRVVDPGGPVVEGEAGLVEGRRARDVVGVLTDPATGRAGGGVVELQEQHVELGHLQGVGHAGVGDDALRRGGEVVRLVVDRGV